MLWWKGIDEVVVFMVTAFVRPVVVTVGVCCDVVLVMKVGVVVVIVM